MKKKIKLQQQIFISFFLIVASLVILQFFFTWYIFSFNIKQTENLEISEELRNFQTDFTNIKLDFFQELSELSSEANFIKYLKQGDKQRLSEQLSNYPLLSNTVIYNNEKQICYGVYWSLINRYADELFDNRELNQEGAFFSENSGKSYLILHKTIIDKQGNIIALAINTISLDKIAQAFLKYDIELVTLPVLQDNNYSDNDFINEVISELIAEKGTQIIIKQNKDKAYGIAILSDLKQNPQIALILNYPREIYNFLNDGIIFFALIILAFSLLIASFMGLWFGKSIMQPVKEISNRMTEISNNPSDIKPFTSSFTGVLGDITGVYSQMSMALIENRRSLLQYKAITDHINVGIFFMDENQNIILCNPAFHKIFLTTDNDNLNLSKLTQIAQEKLHEIGNSQTHNYYFGIFLETSKKYLILDLNINKDGDAINYFGSITDETSMVKSRRAKQSLELELIKSNRLAKIGNLLVGVVHNLNSPLNSIVGYSQFLKRDFPDNSDIDRLHQSSLKISSMVKGLLNKNRNENRSMPQNINVNEVINDELDMCEHNLFFKHYVTVKKDLTEKIKFTNAVYSDISLCIANILNNAVDAMQNSEIKQLSISTFMQNNFVIVKISDSGCGIQPKNLDNIFDINYSSKLAENVGGYGLGLALTKAIVEKSQGKIEVNSTLNVETIFTLYFPKM